jgi:hypothetical protein
MTDKIEADVTAGECDNTKNMNIDLINNIKKIEEKNEKLRQLPSLHEAIISLWGAVNAKISLYCCVTVWGKEYEYLLPAIKRMSYEGNGILVHHYGDLSFDGLQQSKGVTLMRNGNVEPITNSQKEILEKLDLI